MINDTFRKINRLLRTEEKIVLVFLIIVLYIRYIAGVGVLPSNAVIKISILIFSLGLILIIFLFILCLMFDETLKLYNVRTPFNIAKDTDVLKTILHISRDFLPFLLIFLMFESLGIDGKQDLIHTINPIDYDLYLAKIDKYLFGFHASQITERFISLQMTDLMNFVYGLHFPLPLMIALYLYVKNRPVFREFVLSVTITLSVGYLFYFIVPAVGPRYTLEYSVPLSGGSITEFAALAMTAVMSTPRSTFPSLHVAIPTIVLISSFRASKNLFLLTIPIAILIFFSTIYLRHHYLIDLFAGWVLALIQYPVSAELARKASQNKKIRKKM